MFNTVTGQYEPDAEAPAAAPDPGPTVAVPFSQGIIGANMRGPELTAALQGRPAPPPPAPPPPDDTSGEGIPPMLARPEPQDQPPPQAPPPRTPGGGGGAGGPSLASQAADISKAELAAAGTQVAVGNRVNKAAEAGAAAKEKVGADYGGRVDAVNEEYNGEISRLRTKAAAEDDKYKRMGYRDFWADKSTGNKVTAAIAVALGGLGDAFAARGGQRGNYAQNTLGIIDTAIERDAQRQREAIAKQRDVAQTARGNVGLAQQEKAGKLLEVENWKKNAYEMAAAQAEKMEAQAKGLTPEEAANSPLVVGARERALKIGMDIQQQQADIALKRAQTVATYAEAEQRKATAAAKPQRDVYVYGPGGQPIAATNTPEQAKEANKSIATVRQLDGLMSTLQRSYADQGKGYWPLGELKQRQDAIRGQIVIAYKNAAELGAISGSDMKLIDDAVNGGWTGDQANAKLSVARGLLGNGLSTKLDSQGIPGQRIVSALGVGQGVAAPPGAEQAPKPRKVERNGKTYYEVNE